MWARQAKGADGKRAGICESTRWSEGYERLAEVAADLPDGAAQAGGLAEEGEDIRGHVLDFAQLMDLVAVATISVNTARIS